MFRNFSRGGILRIDFAIENWISKVCGNLRKSNKTFVSSPLHRNSLTDSVLLDILSTFPDQATSATEALESLAIPVFFCAKLIWKLRSFNGFPCQIAPHWIILRNTESKPFSVLYVYSRGNSQYHTFPCSILSTSSLVCI